MSAEHDAAIRAHLRPAAEELIDDRTERIMQQLERMLTRSGKINVRYLSGPIPSNLHGPVDERSVIVAHPTFSAAVDLKTLIDQIIARFAFSYAELLIGGQPGDTIYYDADGRGARLGVGDDGQVYTLAAGFPVWADLPSVTITVEEGDASVDAAVTHLDFDASDFNVTSTPAGEANIALAYGTSAGTPAEGNHTHSGLVLKVQEGDSDVDTAVTSIDFDASDFNVTSSPAGEANISLAYGTSAGTPAEGNHTHSGTTITVEEGDSTVDAAVTNLDFDASDFNVTSSPSGEANISLAYGTSAGTPAEGDHTHAASANPLLTVREAQLLKTAGITLHALGLAGFTTQNGTASDQDDAEGPWIGANSGTATGNTGQIFGGNTDCRADWLPDITFVIKTDPTAITAARFVVGPSNANPTAASLATSHHALFFYDTDIHVTAFWRVSNNNGGTPTQTTTSIAIAANTKYVLRVVFSGSDIKYYINGTLAATHSTTMPTTAALSHYIRAENRSAGGAGTNRMVKLGRIAQLTSL